MNLRTPLSQAQGLGSAKTGLHHWWLQRITSVLLAPLAIWLGISLALLPELTYPTLLDWFSHPLPSVLMLLFVAVSCYHMALGLRVIIEDYIHTAWLKVGGIIAVEIGSLLLAFVGILSVIKLFLQ